MTKAELVERLSRDPIVIEPIAKLAYYRIALHGDADPASGVIMALAPVSGTLLVDDYEHVYARVGGKTMRLTYRETELIAARLRRIFRRGGVPSGKRMDFAPQRLRGKRARAKTSARRTRDRLR
ncbi:MAG: hypothetical protein AABO58_10970 [Acidobacteriota bacterium]